MQFAQASGAEVESRFITQLGMQMQFAQASGAEEEDEKKYYIRSEMQFAQAQKEQYPSTITTFPTFPAQQLDKPTRGRL